jgi:hypothetical protein
MTGGGSNHTSFWMMLVRTVCGESTLAKGCTGAGRKLEAGVASKGG